VEVSLPPHGVLYGAAARLAQHLLKPGHFAIFLTGKAHLAEIIHEIEPYLEYRWILAEFQPESEQRCYPVCAFSKFRPTLVFWKPGPSAWTGWIPDAFWSGKAKQWHEWEQSPETFRKVIPAFTTPEALIVDPMVGGGTVPAVAKALGRHYLGFDVEPAAVATTLERLSGIEFGCELTSDDSDSKECAA
jgi:hypothetical protein